MPQKLIFMVISCMHKELDISEAMQLNTGRKQQF